MTFRKANEIAAVKSWPVVRICISLSPMNLNPRGASGGQQSHGEVHMSLLLLLFAIFMEE